MLFFGQPAPDIRWKLQKVDGGGGMTIFQLIEIAFQVYNNHNEAEKREKLKEKWKYIKLEVTLLAAAIVKNSMKGRGRDRVSYHGRALS